MMHKLVKYVICRARDKDISEGLMDSFSSFGDEMKQSITLFRELNKISDWYAVDNLLSPVVDFASSLSSVITFYDLLYDAIQDVLDIHENDSSSYEVNFGELYKNILFEDNKNLDIICFQKELEIFYGKLSSCRNSSFLKDFIFLEDEFTSFYKKEKDLQMAINVFFSEKAKHSDFYDVPFLYNINFFLIRVRDFLLLCRISICSLEEYM